MAAQKQSQGQQITSGRVVYSRTVQPAQFESERAEVELSFVIDDGQPAFSAIDAAMAIAKERVRMSIGPSAQSKRRPAARYRDE